MNSGLMPSINEIVASEPQMSTTSSGLFDIQFMPDRDPLAEAPADPAIGTIYMDSVSMNYYVYVGGDVGWQNMSRRQSVSMGATVGRSTYDVMGMHDWATSTAAQRQVDYLSSLQNPCGEITLPDTIPGDPDDIYELDLDDES
jgi:hypothetical protein